ncbi:MAG: TonB-dependent receptor [Pseudomonadota bacterium]
MYSFQKFPIAGFAPTLAFVLAFPVKAQEPAAVDAGVAIDEVIVRGYRKQSRDALLQKELFDGIGEFLTQDDMGRTPDLNIAESLQRVPGVLTVFDEDEGRYVALRGLSSAFTHITVDGSQLAALDKTERRTITEGIPPTAVSQLEVYKTLTPDRDANAIGGSVNLKSRSAFDAGDTYFVSNFILGDHTAQYLPAGDRLSYNVNSTFSRTFGTADRFGILAYGTYFSKTRDQTKNNRTNGIIDAEPVTRTIIPLDYENTIDRYSYGLKLEARPNAQWYGYVHGSTYAYEYDEFRYNTRLDGNNGTLIQNGPTGSFGEARARASTLAIPLTQDLTNFQLYAEHFTNNDTQIDFTAAYSEAVWEEPIDAMNFDAGTSADFGYAYDFDNLGSEGLASLRYDNAAAVADLARYDLQNYETDFVFMDEDVIELKLNVGWNNDRDAEGLGYKAGLLRRDLERDYNRDRFRFNYTGTEDVSLARFGFISGHVPGRTPGVPMFFGNVGEFLAFVDANRGDFVDDGSSAARSVQSDYAISEDVLAAYAMLTYTADRFKLTGGLRYEETEVEATSFFDNEGAFDTSTRSTSYDNLLPSVQFRYSLSDTMRLTLGLAQAIGRPNHPDIALRESRDIADDGTIVLTRGNPDLEPRQSTNYDIAFDWYYDAGGLFSVAYFYKDIEDEIFRLFSNDVIDGVPVEITQPVNVSESTSQGWELTFVNDRFDSLPAPFDGFGFNMNLTWIDGEIPIPNTDGSVARVSGSLQEQPEFIANAQLLYTIGDLEARLSYSYRDEYFFRLRQNPLQDRIELDYEQLDVSVRYRFTDKLAATAEVRNIGDEPRRNTESGLVRSVNDFGYSTWVGLTYIF